ncbi:hypothetical protein OAR56_01510 [Pelagibacteraceae bacterium]|nr:hypothetical protein [Pelagibacteraceae bacterium]
MSSQINIEKYSSQKENSSDNIKVKVTDLIYRLNEEKKIERKRNLALGIAAASAVTVFSIILTI